MQTTLQPKQGDDPHDFLVVASEGVPVAPAPEPLSGLSPDAVRRPVDSQTETGTGFAAAPPVRPVDATLRPAAVAEVAAPGQRRWIARPLLRIVGAVLLTVGAAVIARQSYGDAAKQMIATWALPSALTSWLPLDKLGLAAAPAPPAATPDTAQVQASRATTPAPGAPQAAAVPSADSAQLLQSMAHDLAAVAQQVDQLKASIEQLKAGQEQMARDVARVSEKASERVARIAPPPVPPRPIPPRARKPAPAPYPLPQAATSSAVPQAAPYYPPPPRQPPPPDAAAQPLPDPELSSAPRPPMPLR